MEVATRRKWGRAVVVGVGSAIVALMAGSCQGSSITLEEYLGFEQRRPIMTTMEDALTGVPFLDKFDPQLNQSMNGLLRGINGEFLFDRPGAYVSDSQSFCLKGGGYGPQSGGDGYLLVPWKGPKADLVYKILVQSYLHPEIPQYQIQMILWALVLGVQSRELPEEYQLAARQILTEQDIRELDGGAAKQIPPELIQAVVQSLPPQIRMVFEIEAALRHTVIGAYTTFQNFESMAVQLGAPPPHEKDRYVPWGRWSYHPGGFFIRFFLSWYTKSRTQIYVPEPFELERDALGRIRRVSDHNGNFVEIRYARTAEALEISGAGDVRAYVIDAVKSDQSGTVAADRTRDLFGTWVNPYYTGYGVAKVVWRPDFTGSAYNMIEDTVPTTSYLYWILDRWADPEGFRYFELVGEYGPNTYASFLLRLSPDGETLESQTYGVGVAELPEAIVPNTEGYGIWEQQPLVYSNAEIEWKGPAWTLVGVPKGSGTLKGAPEAFPDAQARYEWAVEHKRQIDELGRYFSRGGSLEDVVDLGHLCRALEDAEELRAELLDYDRIDHLDFLRKAWQHALSRYLGEPGKELQWFAGSGEIDGAELLASSPDMGGQPAMSHGWHPSGAGAATAMLCSFVPNGVGPVDLNDAVAQLVRDPPPDWYWDLPEFDPYASGGRPGSYHGQTDGHNGLGFDPRLKPFDPTFMDKYGDLLYNGIKIFFAVQGLYSAMALLAAPPIGVGLLLAHAIYGFAFSYVRDNTIDGIYSWWKKNRYTEVPADQYALVDGSWSPRLAADQTREEYPVLPPRIGMEQLPAGGAPVNELGAILLEGNEIALAGLGYVIALRESLERLEMAKEQEDLAGMRMHKQAADFYFSAIGRSYESMADLADRLLGEYRTVSATLPATLSAADVLKLNSLLEGFAIPRELEALVGDLTRSEAEAAEVMACVRGFRYQPIDGNIPEYLEELARELRVAGRQLVSF